MHNNRIDSLFIINHPRRKKSIFVLTRENEAHEIDPRNEAIAINLMKEKRVH